VDLVPAWGKRPDVGQKAKSPTPDTRENEGLRGGEMPIHRRLPKRGFTNIFKKEYSEVNLDRLGGHQKRRSSSLPIW